MNLETLLNIISSELGILINLNRHDISQYDLNDIPTNIIDFYKFTNGLFLPFLTINKIENFERDFYGSWTCFGNDNYFTYCLFDNNGDIDLWNHETGVPPEGVFSSVSDLIEHAYNENITNSSMNCNIVINKIPIDANKATLIKELKILLPLTTNELLTQLKLINDHPLTINSIKRSEAIKLIRTFKLLKVDCSIKINI